MNWFTFLDIYIYIQFFSFISLMLIQMRKIDSALSPSTNASNICSILASVIESFEQDYRAYLSRNMVEGGDLKILNNFLSISNA